MRGQVPFNETKGTAAVSWPVSCNSSTPHAAPQLAHLDLHLLCEAGAVWNLSSQERRAGTQTRPLGSFAMVSTFHLGSFQRSGQAGAQPQAPSINVITCCICWKSTKALKTPEQSLKVAAEQQRCWKGTKWLETLSDKSREMLNSRPRCSSAWEHPNCTKNRFCEICHPEFMQIQIPDSQKYWSE